MLIGFFLMFSQSIAIFMPIFICMFSHTRTRFCFFVFISGGIFQFAGFQFQLSTLCQVFLICVILTMYLKNYIKTDVKIGIFPILIAYWSGFGIFKQNRENPNEIRIVGQSGSKNRCCPLQGRWFMNYIQVTALFYPLNQWFSFDHNHYFDRD